MTTLIYTLNILVIILLLVFGLEISKYIVLFILFLIVLYFLNPKKFIEISDKINEMLNNFYVLFSILLVAGLIIYFIFNINFTTLIIILILFSLIG